MAAMAPAMALFKALRDVLIGVESFDDDGEGEIAALVAITNCGITDDDTSVVSSDKDKRLEVE